MFRPACALDGLFDAVFPHGMTYRSCPPDTDYPCQSAFRPAASLGLPNRFIISRTALGIPWADDIPPASAGT
jgi:hypothetical protein